jgi:nucleoside-diphosphate-sugar epimerase
MLTHGNSQPTKASRVVLLGARGFVAPALAAGLAGEGVNVLAVGSSAVDLCDPASVQRIASILSPGDVIVMAAALTPEKGRDAATMIRNMRMAEHVAAAIQGRSGAQLVYFSSDSVYDSRALPLTESTPAAPVDLYGLMHRAREVALKDAADKAALPFCVLRPCAIYGPGDTHNSYGPNRFIRSSLKDGKVQVFGLGEEIRDHVYIGDVVNLTMAVIARRSAGVLNVVSGEPISFGDLARKVIELTGGRATVESLPRKGAVTHRVFDAAAIGASFPGHVSTRLSAGLASTVAAFTVCT